MVVPPLKIADNLPSNGSPLNGKSMCPKKLSVMGGYPPPFSGKNPLSSFDSLPYLCGTFYLSKLSKPVLKQINSCPTVAVTVDQQGAEKQIVV